MKWGFWVKGLYLLWYSWDVKCKYTPQIEYSLGFIIFLSDILYSFSDKVVFTYVENKLSLFDLSLFDFFYIFVRWVYLWGIHRVVFIGWVSKVVCVEYLLYCFGCCYSFQKVKSSPLYTISCILYRKNTVYSTILLYIMIIVSS